MKQTTLPSSQLFHAADDIDYKEILFKYIKYWPLFAGSLVGFLLLAYLVNLHNPPIYKIESKFLIKEEENTLNFLDMGPSTTGGVLPRGQKIANEIILLKSRTIAEKALEQLPFDVEYYSKGFFINTELYQKYPIQVQVDWNHAQLSNGAIGISWKDNSTFVVELLDKEYLAFDPKNEKRLQMERPFRAQRNFKFNEWVEFPFMKFRVSNMRSESEGSVIVKFRDNESLISQYTGDSFTVASADKLSSILSLSLETTQPQKGRDYLNMLMNKFLEKELDNKNLIAQNTIDFIDIQLSGISDSLSNAQNTLEKFRIKNRVNNISQQGSAISNELANLEKQLAEAEFKKGYYLNLLEYMAREEYTEIIVPSGLGIEDPILNNLIEELIRLQAEKSRFLASQTEDSPTVVEVNRRIVQLTASINEAIKNASDNTNLIISDLKKRIFKAQNQFGRLPGTEQDLLNFERKYSLNENIYTFLVQRRAEAAILLASNRPSNEISEHAVLTFLPMKLKPLLNYFMALLLGVIFPITLIFIKDIFSIYISDVKEIEQKLRVPVLGFIGENKEDSPLVVFNQSRSSITESFRALRTNINFTFQMDKKLTLMVTSMISGEGKTFCAMNLASVYAIGTKRTILIGCDMHKGFLFKDFNISSAPGLSSYLCSQEDDLKSIIQKSEFPYLDILVPGPVPPNPAELLISDRFVMMLTELKQHYDVIILDSAPLGVMNEALYLTQVVDVTIFVLRQYVSEKKFTSDINSLKQNRGLKNLYVVMNDVSEDQLNHKGYGYGYYAEDKAKIPFLKRISIKNKKRKSDSPPKKVS